MATQWLITQKPDFYKALLALPPKETHQVLEKINLLTQDPTPDAKVKKQLKYLDGRLHRIRSGDYRIFYTFEQPFISILALRRRDDDTYDEDLDVEFLGGLDVDIDLPGAPVAAKPAQPDWEKWLAPKVAEKRRLPEPITPELLENLRIPKECHARLLPIQTQDDLLECPGVPDEHLLQINDYMFERPLVQVLQQPDFLLADVNDLLRYKEGELLGFLLKLSPEQERYVTWGMNGSGPTLLKGGPGTGKSTIALYRVRSLVQQLRRQGRHDMRILFTTYTKALVRSSEQLLRQLLGDDLRYVEVQTVDSITMKLLSRGGISPSFLDVGEENTLLKQAVQSAAFKGEEAQRLAQQQAIARISIDYLHQEINQVIVARQIDTLEAYLATPRPGRKVGLHDMQRRAIWSVYTVFQRLLRERGKWTWQQARSYAEQLVAGGVFSQNYDAVVIDEAQDLDPSALRLLLRFCKDTHRIFLTADANQSIYGSGFNWSDVHQRLKFQGRTSVLRVNYRSTREIGEAAQSYLAGGVLDGEQVERDYVHSGPLPAVRVVRGAGEEAQLLARFLPAAARESRLGSSACAVLCPTAKVGKSLAADLTRLGLPATFMSGQELDLSRPGVKVLTLKSAKGLEFPVVVLAGFSNSGWFAFVPTAIPEDERAEFLDIDRRSMFVGMTRAMRALLVLVPEAARSPLMEGFEAGYWNMGS
jgi:superfamily I DNA/RNA helicase/mRNA-degrading endonuclease RelE of RelBE toxin-antitoxin system